MMRLSRLGLAVAITGLLAAQTARAGEPDKLIPADADTITFINVKQLSASDVIKKYALEQLKQALAGEERTKLIEAMGIDALKDVETMWMTTSGKDMEDQKALVILHGDFNKEKIHRAFATAVRKEGDVYSTVKDGGTTLYKFQPEEGNPTYAVVIDEKTVVIGTDKKITTAAVEQAKDGKKSKVKAELAALIKPMDSKATIYAVSLVKDKFANVKLPAQDFIDLSGLEKALPNTDTLSIVIKVTEDIQLEVVFGMKDAESAEDMNKAMADLIQTIKGLVPLLAAADAKAKPLVDVVKTLKATVKDKNVTLSAKITGEIIGKLLNPDG
jgi:hypothetical protein